MRKRLISGALAVLASLAAAFSPLATRSSAATTSTRFHGTYVAYFTGKERSSGGSRGHTISPGAWTLVLKAHEAVFYDPMHPDPEDIIRVKLRSSGNRLVFGPERKCTDQRLPASVGVYSGARSGKTLRFKKTRDSCNDRAAVLTAHPWTKISSRRTASHAGASVVATIRVDDATGMVDTGFRSVWVANGSAGTVSRIDPNTNSVVKTIALQPGVFGLRTGNGAVWVTNSAENTLSRIDPATYGVLTIPVGTFPIGLAVTPGAIWVANHHGPPATGSIMRIDPTTNTVVATIPLGVLPFDGPKFVAAGAGSVWVGVPNLGAVVRISAATDQIEQTIPVGGVCTGIAADDTSVWVAGWYGPGCATGVTHIDASANAVVGAKIDAGGCVADVAIGFGSVWYTTCKSQFVGRIDQQTNAVTSLLKIDGQPTSVAIDFGSAWVLDAEHGRVLRLQPE